MNYSQPNHRKPDLAKCAQAAAAILLLQVNMAVAATSAQSQAPSADPQMRLRNPVRVFAKEVADQLFIR